MFRARIYAQGFTLLAMVAGSMYWQTDRQKRKEFEGALAERKAKEKNEAWIRELEARDEEAKEIRAQRERRRAGVDVQNTVERVGEKVKGTVEKENPVEVTVAKSVVDEKEKRKGVLESVQGLWGGKK